MNSIVIGLGEVGLAVRIVTESKYSYDIKDILDDITFPEYLDVMHICFPYNDNFIAEIRMYCQLFKPKHVAIWSSIPIGTTHKIDARIVHTPLEGRHPDLELSIRHMLRWIGADDMEEGRWFSNYFNNLGLRTKIVSNSQYTEALKLLSTTEYGLNIEFARYKKQIADNLEMPYELMKEWNVEYNWLYRNLGLADKYQKFVLEAPEGNKGGHCITPNAKLLYEQYPSDLVKIVGEL